MTKLIVVSMFLLWGSNPAAAQTNRDDSGRGRGAGASACQPQARIKSWQAKAPAPRHCAGASLFNSAGQLTITVSGFAARPGVAPTRKRCPSGAVSYGLQPLSTAGSGKSSRGVDGSTVSAAIFRLTAISLLSGET